jgi:hypothetical protein
MSYVLAADHLGWASGSVATVPARLTYDGIPNIELDGAAGGNLFTVNGRAAGTTTFVYAGAGSDKVQLSGNVNSYAGTLCVYGQGGVNTLDYSKYRGSVTVNLLLDTATAVSGGISKFRNVTGSVGNNLLVGDGTGNVLIGGTGRSILIAGAHPGTLVGNSGQDLLVGGTTDYDSSPPALAAIMAEWTSGASYANRVNHLLTGGGLNGNTLLSSTTFTNNGGGNTLSGADGVDLFYGIKARDTNDWDPGIKEVFIENPALVSFQLDAHALSEPLLWLDNSTIVSTATPAPYMVAPGVHTLVDYWGGNFNAAAATFTVRADGKVTYDLPFDQVLGGNGTGTLLVKGATITIDARALYTPRLTVDYGYVPYTASLISLTVLPGPQELFDTWATGSTVPFNVTPDGRVEYDASSFGGFLSGEDTPTLTITGFQITIDAHTLSTPLLTVDVSNARPTSSPITINVLPGPQSLWDYYGSGPTLNFTVTTTGKIDYTDSPAGVFSGAGTTTLTVTGQNVTIDPRALSAYALVVDTAIPELMTSVFTLQLLPGDHWLTDNYGYSAPLHFTVGDSGGITYADSLAGVFTGAGTALDPLTLNGITLQIDATAISGNATYFSLDYFQRPTAQVETLTVLPATFQFNAGSEQFTFTLSAQYGLDYDMSLDSILSGRSTDRLTITQ